MKKLLIFILFLVNSGLVSAQASSRMQSYCNKFKVSDGIKITKITTTVTDSSFTNVTEIHALNLYLFKDNNKWVLFQCGNCCILETDNCVITYDDRLRVIIELSGGSIINDYYY